MPEPRKVYPPPPKYHPPEGVKVCEDCRRMCFGCDIAASRHDDGDRADEARDREEDDAV